MKYDLIIIGAGPAGITAAIYGLRANLNVLIIEKESNGGKLSKTSRIDNYPGISNINGLELAEKFVEQAKSLGATIISGNVTKIDNDKNIYLENDESYSAKAIVIATGCNEKMLDIARADEFVGKGISYCAVCDGFFYRNKEIVVIGGGNSALEEAIFLSSIAKKVTIVIRRDEFRADESLVEEIKNNDKIEIIYKHLPDSLNIVNEKIAGLYIKNVDDNQVTLVECQGIFPYIGSYPATSFLDKSLLDEKGYLIVDNNMASKTEGIFAAGDCIQKQLRQIITACSDGAVAANSAIKYIKN